MYDTKVVMVDTGRGGRSQDKTIRIAPQQTVLYSRYMAASHVQNSLTRFVFCGWQMAAGSGPTKIPLVHQSIII